jgi:malonyl-CoA decarboxylase
MVGPSDVENATGPAAGWAALWRRFAGGRAGTEGFAERERSALEATLRASLKSHAGDEPARARFTAIAERYRRLSPTGRLTFFKTLASFDVDVDAVAELAAQYAAQTASHERAAVRKRLRAALEAPRTTLLRRFNGVPDGVKFLVDMRADLLAESGDESLAELEGDLKALLISWFDVGFLELRRITWDAPASLLERLARYEAVHEMRGWADLKNRLDTDRRCYAFFHPAMPLEPLIFIELALTNDVSERVAPLLDPAAPVGNSAEANVAVFYSISNCQQGLEGISFGNALIKRVAGEVAAGLPNIRRFCTLSPLPGFCDWLKRANAAGDEPSALLAALERRGWQRDTGVTAALREPLLRLCARYLLEERRSGGRALDPVAHFHLSNGASIERINWMADTSKRGLHTSAGMMVNYSYRLDRIDANQSAYASGRIEASPAVLSLSEAENRLTLTGALAALKIRT